MSQVLRQLLEVVPQELVNRKDAYGWFPLHRLANGKDVHNVRPGMIRQLIVARADVDIEKKRGVTPLMSAVSTGFIAAADELMLQGADIYKTNDEGTTIYDAAWHKKGMREWCRRLGVGEGAGVSGSGRLHTCQPNRLAPNIQQKSHIFRQTLCTQQLWSRSEPRVRNILMRFCRRVRCTRKLVRLNAEGAT